MSDTDNVRVNRMKYHNAETNLDIIVEVHEPPMGSGSGYIPPPIIEFFKDGRVLGFGYRGSADV